MNATNAYLVQTEAGHFLVIEVDNEPDLVAELQRGGTVLAALKLTQPSVLGTTSHVTDRPPPVG